jgi:phosphoglycolate phosphatase-like HAD superfamily hydrolase
MTLVVFDVDGCLIDSRELIREAYREAGVVAPDNILECEGVDWLRDLGYTPVGARAIKARKNEEYLRLVSRDRAPTLPAYNVACRLADEGHACHVYTAGPHGSLAALQRRLPRWPFQVGRDGVPTPERMRLLRTWTRGGVYVDDQSRLVRLPDRWRFVHVDGQDADELYKMITSEGS